MPYRAPDLQTLCDAHFLCALVCTGSHAWRFDTSSNMSPAAQVQTHLCVLKQLPAAQQFLDRCYTALPHPQCLPQLIMCMHMQAKLYVCTCKPCDILAAPALRYNVMRHSITPVRRLDSLYWWMST